MGKIKVRKIGNYLGAIFPKEWGLHEGDILSYKKEGNLHILDAQDTSNEYDRKMIEESFADFEEKNVLSEDEMTKIFSKYGWGK